MSGDRKTIDKDLYRQAYQLYQQHSDEKDLERVRYALRLSSAERWRQYVGLWQFCMKFAPPETELQGEWRMAELNHYYATMQTFEARRRTHGEISRTPVRIGSGNSPKSWRDPNC